MAGCCSGSCWPVGVQLRRELVRLARDLRGVGGADDRAGRRCCAACCPSTGPTHVSWLPRPARVHAEAAARAAGAALAGADPGVHVRRVHRLLDRDRLRAGRRAPPRPGPDRRCSPSSARPVRRRRRSPAARRPRSRPGGQRRRDRARRGRARAGRARRLERRAARAWRESCSTSPSSAHQVMSQQEIYALPRRGPRPHQHRLHDHGVHQRRDRVRGRGRAALRLRLDGHVLVRCRDARPRIDPVDGEAPSEPRGTIGRCPTSARPRSYCSPASPALQPYCARISGRRSTPSSTSAARSSSCSAPGGESRPCTGSRRACGARRARVRRWSSRRCWR